MSNLYNGRRGRKVNKARIQNGIMTTLVLLAFFVFFFGIVYSLTGKAGFLSWIGEKKGQLVGRGFTISQYNNFSEKTMEITGTKVTVGLLENSANFNSESTGFKSEVLEVTINGQQMFGVGNTLIFAEYGLDMVADYTIKEDININDGGGYVPIDKIINSLSNKIGKPKTIVIYGQTGEPIGVYQGKEVFVTIPTNIPKTTLLNIDGKALYIHRANYTILDSSLIK